MNEEGRDNIANPADGLIIYNTDAHQLEIYHANTGTWGPIMKVEWYEIPGIYDPNNPDPKSPLLQPNLKIVMGQTTNAGEEEWGTVCWENTPFTSKILHVFINTQRYLEWSARVIPGNLSCFNLWTEKGTGTEDFMVIGY